ncbi:MAG: hypothetical protein ACREOI_16135 [bacterium]
MVLPHGLQNPTDDLLKDQWNFSIRGEILLNAQTFPSSAAFLIIVYALADDSMYAPTNDRILSAGVLHLPTLDIDRRCFSSQAGCS